MTRISRKIFALCLLLLALGALTGCRSILDEDPNQAQIPWATPADWEGQLPGMPTGNY